MKEVTERWEGRGRNEEREGGRGREGGRIKEGNKGEREGRREEKTFATMWIISICIY